MIIAEHPNLHVVFSLATDAPDGSDAGVGQILPTLASESAAIHLFTQTNNSGKMVKKTQYVAIKTQSLQNGIYESLCVEMSHCVLSREAVQHLTPPRLDRSFHVKTLHYRVEQ
jgi:hypothetical protein